MIKDLGEGDILLMMLGTNDLLLTDMPDADIPISKLDKLLSYAKLMQGALK